MKKYLSTTLILVVFTTFMASAGKLTSKEQLLVGKWKPVSVERIDIPQAAGNAAMDKKIPGTPAPEGQAKENTQSGQPAQTGKVVSDKGGKETSERSEGDKLERFIRGEERAPLTIFADHTAMKEYRKNIIKASWKMKASGKKIVVRNIKNKEKYTLKVLELTETQLVIIEKLPAGSLKITYTRE
ncbi:MAG TPA: hypothetical protein PLD52_01145 [Bacteroidales bacterium]|nr:hypothetical protein [Bacteroidales bacterium]